MKELIKKVLREEVSKKFTKGNVEKENFIKKHMEKLLSETKRVVIPSEENYGNYSEEWCKNDKVIVTSRYYFNDEDSDEEKFYSGSLFVDEEITEFLTKILQVRKSFVLNVITEWYDEKYATKFGQETGHPELEIDETHETDNDRKCYQIIDTSNLSREYMIDYINTNTLYKLSELENLPDDELEIKYRSVYNIKSNE
jgi:3-methyladenine DNA glycosylase AlkC